MIHRPSAFPCALTSTCLNANTNKVNNYKKRKNKPVVFIKAAVMCTSEYTKILVRVCFCRSGPQCKHSMCVRVYVAVRWDCSIYAVMCHTWLWIHVSPVLPSALQICVLHAWAWVCDRQTSAEVWRLMTALRPLMTPSILSPSTRADYPQRHLLILCMLMKQREGVMRKEWQIKKKKGWGGGQKRNRRLRHRNQCIKAWVRRRNETKCLDECDRGK